MEEKIQLLTKESTCDLENIKSEKEVSDFWQKYFSKNGKFSQLMTQLGSVSKEDRPVFGASINNSKSEILARYNKRAEEIKVEVMNKKLSDEKIDISFLSKSKKLGTLHPITLVKNEICEIFNSLGFATVEGPEIETDYYNFQLLNVPKDHPARDMQDTFYITDNFVLRTHTSPMQARVMQSQKPPIRVIVPGKVYRSDDDATHSPIFHQIEGLAIDKNLSLSDLKGTLEAFASKLFNKDTKIRLRSSYFPFTEPSVEVDVSCAICHGDGCKLCKNTGWLEILGAGIVNPKVLEMSNIDPNEYTGFAFGLGIERIAMIKYQIPNIKMFYENDIKFLKQFV
jgi:phenylalanine--tRNA ligase, alpha subunit